MALPTKAMREVTSEIDSLIDSKKTFIHVAKGIENDTFKRVSEMIEDSISRKITMVVSGFYQVLVTQKK